MLQNAFNWLLNLSLPMLISLTFLILIVGRLVFRILRHPIQELSDKYALRTIPYTLWFITLYNWRTITLDTVLIILLLRGIPESFDITSLLFDAPDNLSPKSMFTSSAGLLTIITFASKLLIDIKKELDDGSSYLRIALASIRLRSRDARIIMSRGYRRLLFALIALPISSILLQPYVADFLAAESLQSSIRQVWAWAFIVTASALIFFIINTLRYPLTNQLRNQAVTQHTKAIIELFSACKSSFCEPDLETYLEYLESVPPNSEEKSDGYLPFYTEPPFSGFKNYDSRQFVERFWSVTSAERTYKRYLTCTRLLHRKNQLLEALSKDCQRKAESLVADEVRRQLLPSRIILSHWRVKKNASIPVEDLEIQMLLIKSGVKTASKLLDSIPENDLHAEESWKYQRVFSSRTLPVYNYQEPKILISWHPIYELLTSYEHSEICRTLVATECFDSVLTEAAKLKHSPTRDPILKALVRLYVEHALEMARTDFERGMSVMESFKCKGYTPQSIDPSVPSLLTGECMRKLLQPEGLEDNQITLLLKHLGANEVIALLLRNLFYFRRKSKNFPVCQVALFATRLGTLRREEKEITIDEKKVIKLLLHPNMLIDHFVCERALKWLMSLVQTSLSANVIDEFSDKADEHSLQSYTLREFILWLAATAEDAADWSARAFTLELQKRIEVLGYSAEMKETSSTYSSSASQTFEALREEIEQDLDQDRSENR